jgi:hypothetical protein
LDRVTLSLPRALGLRAICSLLLKDKTKLDEVMAAEEEALTGKIAYKAHDAT